MRVDSLSLRHCLPALLLAAVVAWSVGTAASVPDEADAAILKPPRGKTFFGVTDTGDTSGFKDFAVAAGKRPAVIQTFHAWGNSLDKAAPRWRELRARPMLHITTRADDGTELITPRQIALGFGDEYLLRLNWRLSISRMRTYLRPLGEPNRCLNAYAGVDCSGQVRGGAYSFHWYRQAFRRIAIVVRGGGKRRAVNRRLGRIGLPGLRKTDGLKRLPKWLRRAPVALVWSPLPAGSPTIKVNFPAKYWPGGAWVDWVGTDFYSRYNNWKHLKRFYLRFAKGKKRPMALTEFGLWGEDSPGFMKRIFRFAATRRQVRMMVYYQDFGSSNPFRIQNFPMGRRVLNRNLNSPRFPRLAPNHPQPRSAGTGGLGRP